MITGQTKAGIGKSAAGNGEACWRRSQINWIRSDRANAGRRQNWTGIIDCERGGPQQTIAARSGLVVNLYSDIACTQSWQWSGKTGCVGREGNGERSAIARGGASLGDKATTEGEVDYGQTKAGIGNSLPAMVKLAGGEARSIGLGVIEPTPGGGRTGRVSLTVSEVVPSRL